ncbi:ShlB/FhaC/HecB family hemolysin secretion/activation protein [Cylindrospermum sp. FACHB-282]|uniref:ShlB/FhaC/HecB family hemolysin secretion/activation protein n=1 Tax=Cylindrospermum sp. FACHB-282 TaxID=2692794 RepID=UPI0016854810|nr:ShlB/FhaC/HecB family hemolysin secretion/activation protein [Cylindrospermum sp. FACHB-282]MBD2387016.1 ShlB/FhaC/HecB family hemolysin secretion/activation protein [Cylindrospermum sp. FACHB-282]
MINKSPENLALYWLQLTIFVLVGSMTSRPLKAQTVETGKALKDNAVFAQQLPPSQDVQPSSPSPFPTPQLLPPPGELLAPSEPTASPDENFPVNAPANIIVERFEVVGSTVFSSEELAEVTKKFTKNRISLVEVFQAASKITELYIKNGYITSGAYIPPQTIQSGVVKIQVIEGKLEDIQVSYLKNSTQRLNPNYIRSRLAIATKAPLNRDRLLEALQLLQLNPLIENLSAELSAGSRSGVSVLKVEISEAKTFNTQVVLDNGRSPSVGSLRRRLNVSEANLLGLGDSLSVGYTNTDGSNAFEANYTLPLNSRNGTLIFSVGSASSNVIERPVDILGIESNFRYYELTFRQPIFQTPRQEFTLGLSASRTETEASYDEEDRQPFPLLGADNEGRTRLSVLRFFQEWTARNSQEVFALRSQFNLGTGAFNATFHEQAPDGRFFAWRGQGQWVRLLASDMLLLLRGNMQFASRALVPLEQFGLGGQESVRGYRQDYILSDNGAFASAELQVPILRLPKKEGILHVIPFADVGVVWNTGRDDPEPNTLAAVGLGLRWTQGDRFTARLDWGIPLIAVESQNKTWQENGLHFSLQYSPF